MLLPENLLAVLVCPACKRPLILLPDESGFKCNACKLIYPVRDGIPCMLAEEALPASD